MVPKATHTDIDKLARILASQMSKERMQDEIKRVFPLSYVFVLERQISGRYRIEICLVCPVSEYLDLFRDNIHG